MYYPKLIGQRPQPRSNHQMIFLKNLNSLAIIGGSSEDQGVKFYEDIYLIEIKNFICSKLFIGKTLLRHSF